MRVLHVIPTLVAGGAERFVAQLVEHQNRHGIDARACVFLEHAADAKWCARIPPPMELAYQPWRRANGPWSTRSLVAALRKTIERVRPDIVHAHLWPACRVVWRAVRRLPVMQVWHIHDTMDWLTGTSVYARLRQTQLRWMIRSAEPLMIACSDAARQTTCDGLKLPSSRVKVVRNGVDTTAFPRRLHGPCSDQHKVLRIIVSAAFRPMKGHANLVEAARQLKEEGLQFKITFAGDSNIGTGKEIASMVSALRLDDVVHFAGHVADMVAALHSHDIFCLPSVDTEGLPLALLEAMSCGLPAVATKVGGVPEVFIDGVHGFVVQPRNPNALADRLRALIESQELRNKMGSAGADWVRKNCSFVNCVNGIVREYHAYAEARRGSR